MMLDGWKERSMDNVQLGMDLVPGRDFNQFFWYCIVDTSLISGSIFL